MPKEVNPKLSSGIKITTLHYDYKREVIFKSTLLESKSSVLNLIPVRDFEINSRDFEFNM
jgi:hypothetical protein